MTKENKEHWAHIYELAEFLKRSGLVEKVNIQFCISKDHWKHKDGYPDGNAHIRYFTASEIDIFIQDLKRVEETLYLFMHEINHIFFPTASEREAWEIALNNPAWAHMINRRNFTRTMNYYLKSYGDKADKKYKVHT